MITFSQLGTYGRLGNQLFQIAATIGIAKKSNHSFVFPKWKYSGYFLNALPEGSLPGAKKYRQAHPWYYPIELDYRNWDLEGYFQSELFFAEEKDLIRHYFKPVKEIDEYISHKYGSLLKDNTCSVHVRRADYLKFNLTYPPLSKSYYDAAMSAFNNDTLFIFFSDDINWCRKNFTGKNLYFMSGESEINDLFLMSKCKSHIIANSSFSWWGAWLNPDERKKVIAPSYWFGPASTIHYKKRNQSILSSGIQVISDTKEPGPLHSFFIYLYSKTSYFLVYKLKNIIPAFIRNKMSQKLNMK